MDFSSIGTWKNPFVVSKTAKKREPLSLSRISSSVYELQTGQTMYLFRSDGSRQILRDPFGFQTVTNKFNHSGVGPEIEAYFDIIPAFSIRSNSSLNGHFIARGTLWGGFCTSWALSLRVLETGGTLNLPIPLKRCLYFGLFTIHCLVIVLGIAFFSEMLPCGLFSEMLSKLLTFALEWPVQDWWMGQLKFTS